MVILLVQGENFMENHYTWEFHGHCTHAFHPLTKLTPLCHRRYVICSLRRPRFDGHKWEKRLSSSCGVWRQIPVDRSNSISSLCLVRE
jgi:hypothetical protein